MHPGQIAGLAPQDILSQARTLLIHTRTHVSEQDLQAILAAIHPREAGAMLTLEEAQQLIDLLARREQGEPMAYLLQRITFMERTFYINRSVMVTRPKMAEVVRAALRVVSRLRARLPEQEIPVAEIGTGCGALAITFALQAPYLSRIYATDLSPEALIVAARNCVEHQVADRITLLQGDLLEPLPERVRLLIANLPFMSRELRGDLAPEVRESEPRIRDYEPPLAIYGDEDGLGHQRRMLGMAAARVLPGAFILLTLHWSQKQRIEQLVRHTFPRARLDFAAIDADWSALAIIEIP